MHSAQKWDSLFDLERLHTIFANDEKAINHFIETFVEENAQLLTNLSQAIQAQQQEEAKAFAHRLKGSCGSAGADKMGELAKKMEEAIIQNQWEQAKTYQDNISTLLKKVK